MIKGGDVMLHYIMSTILVNERRMENIGSTFPSECDCGQMADLK